MSLRTRWNTNRLELRTLESRIAPAEIPVTTALDSGAGSLRQAIIEANKSSGLDTITFAIPSAAPIVLTTPLPDVIHPVVINGATQPGYTDEPLVELVGTSVAGAGLVITTGGSTVRALNIHSFNGAGIRLESKGGNLVAGCYIGCDRAGQAKMPNLGDGIFIDSPNNIIGGTTDADRNVISGNGGDGIEISGEAASNNVIFGNYIGMKNGGQNALGNTDDGILINNAPFNIIGGEARNVISGNGTSGSFNNGVYIIGTGSHDNLVAGNYIGVDVDGTEARGNNDGVRIENGASNNIIGGPTVAARNVISGNRNNGITILSSNTQNNKVLGNYIGTGTGGNGKLANAEDGIRIRAGAANNTIGGSSPDSRNVISGNGAIGVHIFEMGSSGNKVQANYIGTNAAGDAAIGNGDHGVKIDQGATLNLVGGSSGAGNVLTGNNGCGVSIVGGNSSNNSVVGNLIGFDAAATVSLGNGQDGIRIKDGNSNNRLSRNLIASSGDLAIDLRDDGVTANDPLDSDNGPNGLQNYPTITGVIGGASTRIVGFLNSTPNTNAFTIEFFATTGGDPTGHGEGHRYLGSSTVNTVGNGDAYFDVTLSAATLSTEFITATATDSDGNTSEFSSNRRANPAIYAVRVNDGAAQRSRVTSLAVDFGLPITLPTNAAEAFQLKRQSDDAAVTMNASVTGTTVTLTFTAGPVEFGSLADGRYTLTAFASKINGGDFDGNGDGTPGDDYALIGSPANGLFRLFGDADGNGTVNTVDFSAFRSAFGGSSTIFDFDNQGGVGTSDFGQFRARFGSSV